MLKSLVLHFSKYSLSNVLIALAGLISFPILTRMLTVEQYGIMSLIGATLTLAASFGKFGIQHSALRFYSEIKSGNSSFNLKQYFSTIITFSILAGSVCTLLWVAVLLFFPDRFYESGTVLPSLFIASSLIFIRILYSAITNIYRAKEFSGIVSTYSVILKYGTLTCIFLLLFLWQKNLMSIYAGTVIWEMILLILISIHLFKRFSEYIGFSINLRLLKTMLLYGVPMLGTELAYGLLNTGDRYIIQYLMGSDKLGEYAAAYNLCNIINGVIALSVAMAVRPMYLRIWAEEGEEKTQNFIEMSIRYYCLAAIPIVFGLTAIADDLIRLLASEKYLSGSVVVPYVMLGFAIYGSSVIIAAGIYIYKQSINLMVFVIGTVVLNIALNFALIPFFKLEGAAMATLISFSALTAMMYIYSVKYLYIKIPAKKISIYCVASMIMYFVITQISLGSNLYNLLSKVMVGIALYAIIIFIVERDIRNMVLKFYTHKLG